MNSKSNIMQLKLFGLPVIESLDDFSFYTHLSKKHLFQHSKFSNKYYKTYPVSKGNGKSRTISQPSKSLKVVQSWILFYILNKLKVSPSCKGFEKGLNILDNASPHLNATAILSLDIKDFFPSIPANKIYNIYRILGYNSVISTIFTNLCCYNNSLPQGSPCSPKLSNIVCLRMDSRIQGYVSEYGIVYTRYADDLTFSSFSPNKLSKLIPVIRSIIKTDEFKLNDSKTRIVGTSRAKRVTGLIVADSKIGIGKKKYKLIRSKIHHLTLKKNIKNFKLLEHVRGYLAFMKSVDQDRYDNLLKYINVLKQKHSKELISKLNV